MQRLASWFLLVAALYVSVCASATSDPLPAYGEEPPSPHIALLLPLQSDAFGQAAEAVQQGFMAASNAQPHQLPVRIYSSFDEKTDITALYLHALANGAKAVVGPLTRNGVAVLAANPDMIKVPTLALNVAEGIAPDNLYFFGLSIEDEARQIAQIAFNKNLTKANVIDGGSPLSRRLAQAFADEWVRLGGTIETDTLYNGEPAIFANLPNNGPPPGPPPGPDDPPPPPPPPVEHMVFLAAEADKARLIRPYIPLTDPVYATSQLFTGNNDTLLNYDLNEIHFVDMPWLLAPDHPAVMIYPRPELQLGPDMERLYALGIDAFRLLQIMLKNSEPVDLPLDGVTGNIHLDGNHRFVREGMPAQFKKGRGLTPQAEAALAAEMRASARAAAQSAVAATTTAQAKPATP